ncbi:hypothetical protein L596_028020 [Steinernema carpocapsae]|uniref:Uncharacterized protein n=1 Tax=Steinernema carpocapsae TaxID=34508 RepID=A0A4U5LXC1_STECR|nr:hypothetical protein L596_028020 [Steinernema carpocapsae]
MSASRSFWDQCCWKICAGQLVHGLEQTENRWSAADSAFSEERMKNSTRPDDNSALCIIWHTNINTACISRSAKNAAKEWTGANADHEDFSGFYNSRARRSF